MQKEYVMAAACKHSNTIVLGAGKHRGNIFLTSVGIQVCLNPIERTLYRLFLTHPEGLQAEGLLGHWHELCDIYLEESRFDDKPLRDSAIESLCSESKKVFYTTISRIKKKFTEALGARKAAAYIIKRNKDGLYRTKATLADFPTASAGAAHPFRGAPPAAL
ncbi:MAG: hypothetical protein J5759_01905 [Bacteroidales bacterium]|nr:hypothetical protein [Bacteroidales bacterium]